MYQSSKGGWVNAIACVLAVLLFSGCGGGGAVVERDVSSNLNVQVETGNGNGTTVGLSSVVLLDKCLLTYINGQTETYDFADCYQIELASNVQPKLKYARVLAKNGNDYWYFDRSGDYLSQGANDSKVAIPGDY